MYVHACTHVRTHARTTQHTHTTQHIHTLMLVECSRVKAVTDDEVSVDSQSVKSHDTAADDDSDIVLAEYDSDTAVTGKSCDTEERYHVYAYNINVVYKFS